MSRWIHELIAAVGIVGTMIVAAAAGAGVVALVGEAGGLPWYGWVIASPLLYLGCLVLYLALSACTTASVGRRHPKPRHAIVDRTSRRRTSEMLGLATATMCYRRLALVDSLPLVALLSFFRTLDTLVLRSYSPSHHIGRGVINMGLLYDPDLTELGDNVVIGGGAAVAAHSMAKRANNALVYVSAPVRIEERATIGGEARIALGCVIGRDAVVEAGAVVEPFTRIPPGEVWGGNPARFRRRRDEVDVGHAHEDVPAADSPAARPDAAAQSVEVAHDRARQLVLDALGLTPDDAPDDLSTTTCALWDSLGQVAIAAALFDRHGITVDGPEIFRLRTVDDVARALTGIDPAGESETTSPESPPAAVPAASVELPADRELLPLLDAQQATRALAASPDDQPHRGTLLSVYVAASFTAQPIEPALKLWGRAFGFEIECRFAGHGQIVQALFDPGDPQPAGAEALTVVLARPEDLAPDSADSSAVVDEILDAVEHAAANRPAGTRLIIGTLPPVVSSFSTLDRDRSEAMRQRWRDRMTAIRGVELFDFSALVERIGVAEARSSTFEALARGGYSQRMHQEIAIALVRQIRAARGPIAKVIALDCDNTLWGGVVGELGVEGLELGPDGAGRSFQLFQRYLKRLQDRGLLLVVASRNEETDVSDVFANHPGMVLKADDIAAWRVNWQHKSENLVQLAEELNLGLESFVFLDDDPAARLEVMTRAPSVHVVPLPEDPALYCETLDRLWLFDAAETTAIDATRTRKTHEENQRRRELDSTGSLGDFLARLELEVEIREADEPDLPRVAQLVQRTNQFNLSLRRRTLAEVKELHDDWTVLVLDARDRFGDYGQVGVCVLRPTAEPELWEVETLLMSCRALGRGIEDAFLHGIAAAAAERGGRRLLAPYRAGPRNQVIRDFLVRTGFEEEQPDAWTLPIERLPALPRHVQFLRPHGAGSPPRRLTT